MPTPPRPRAGAPLARQMLASLWDHYAVRPGTLGSGQLLHGTYSKKSPYNTCTPEGVDECTSWGDYFYMESADPSDQRLGDVLVSRRPACFWT